MLPTDLISEKRSMSYFKIKPIIIDAEWRWQNIWLTPKHEYDKVFPDMRCITIIHVVRMILKGLADCLSAEWIIDELSEASCVVNQTIYKGDQYQVFQQ